MQEKIKNYFKKYGLITISSMALCLSIYGCFFKRQPLPIGAVDMKKMVTILSKDLVKQYPTGQIPKDKLEQLIGYINVRILMFAEKNKKVIFLNKQNMLTGEMYDCTDEIIKAIQQTE